jgi:hypothetical protein
VSPDTDGTRPDADGTTPETDSARPDADGDGSGHAVDAANPDAGSAGATGDTTAAGAEGGSQAGAGSRSPEVEEAISRRIAEAVQDGKTFVDDPFDENGKLLPNVVYRTGEFDSYIGITDSEGRLVRMSADDLRQSHTGRQPHNADTPGKIHGLDHAGHLIADRFGGSGQIDNLVSQLGSSVNQSKYRIIENRCADALKAGKSVSFDVVVLYDGSSSRPTGFVVNYSIDGLQAGKDIKIGNI